MTGCETTQTFVCSGCGARYTHLPGVRCPRCGTPFEVCISCQGCVQSAGIGGGESVLARIQRWMADQRAAKAGTPPAGDA